MNDTALQCFWREGRLVVVLESETVELASTAGIRALKQNRLEDREVRLFDPDDPRRMSLIQEQISGLRD